MARLAQRPANDNAPTIRPLLWLDFVEVDGHILLAANFDGNVDALRALPSRGSVRDVEMAVNTIFLDQLFAIEKYADEDLHAFGAVMCDSLRVRAALAFPGRRFTAEVISDGDTGRVGVRLFQDYRRAFDA